MTAHPNHSVSPSLRWVDNHCHFGDDLDASLAAAASAGVERMIDVGCDVATSTACIERARTYDQISATAGIHPHEAQHGIAGLRELIETQQVVAVGECGLDFHYDHSPRKAQADVFAAQIGLAHEFKLPLVIHTREAWTETFDILDREGTPDRTIFHCFTGGPDEASQCLERDGFLSFSGIVTFKSATDVQQAVKLCRADRLLIETDSPYLAPVPHRGRPNQPALVPVVGSAVAKLRSMPVSDVAMLTWNNAEQAYPRLNPSMPG